MVTIKWIWSRLMHVSLGGIYRKVRKSLRAARIFKLDHIPRTSLGEIVRKPIVLVDGLYSYVDGSLPWCDILALLSILVDRLPDSVLEIGTFNGSTTRLIALNLPNAQIYTVDLPEVFNESNAGLQKDDFHLISSRRVGSAYKADPSVRNVQQLFGDTAELDFPKAEAFFIDGSHTYDYVRNDTEKALASPCAKTLIWHDCDDRHPGVVRWLVQMVRSGHPVRQIDGTNLAILDLRSKSPF